MLAKSGEYVESEVKRQIPLFHTSGKLKSEILRKYDQIAPTYVKWLEQKQLSESIYEKESQRNHEVELNFLREENQRLLEENNILKQALLIIGQK